MGARIRVVIGCLRCVIAGTAARQRRIGVRLEGCAQIDGTVTRLVAVDPGVGKAGCRIVPPSGGFRWRIERLSVVVDAVALTALVSLAASEVLSVVGHVGPAHRPRIVQNEQQVRLHGLRGRRDQRDGGQIGRQRKRRRREARCNEQTQNTAGQTVLGHGKLSSLGALNM